MRQGDGPRALSCDVAGMGSARSVSGLLTLPSATPMLEVTDVPWGSPQVGSLVPSPASWQQGGGVWDGV